MLGHRTYNPEIPGSTPALTLGFVSRSPVFKSEATLCRKPIGLPPTSSYFKHMLCSVCIFSSLIYSGKYFDN